MWLVEGIVAGLVGGFAMGLVSEIGNRLGFLKSNLYVIDGSFALRMIGKGSGTAMTYALGIPVHLGTSAIFGLIYAALSKPIGFDMLSAGAISLYVAILWVTMLVMALPAAGQGMLGKKIGQMVWLEQVGLHAIYGVILWLILKSF